MCSSWLSFGWTCGELKEKVAVERGDCQCEGCCHEDVDPPPPPSSVAEITLTIIVGAAKIEMKVQTTTSIDDVLRLLQKRLSTTVKVCRKGEG